ncbi:hypothetical protein BGZ63DRAFT_150548 [Mariannaea sp. PMI_226]|nr:hypothetical protein BGZ63DRAFT_150548 [Mariannaea sp. PMI_226]
MSLSSTRQMECSARDKEPCHPPKSLNDAAPIQPGEKSALDGPEKVDTPEENGTYESAIPCSPGPTNTTQPNGLDQSSYGSIGLMCHRVYERDITVEFQGVGARGRSVWETDWHLPTYFPRPVYRYWSVCEGRQATVAREVFCCGRIHGRRTGNNRVACYSNMEEDKENIAPGRARAYETIQDEAERISRESVPPMKKRRVTSN